MAKVAVSHEGMGSDESRTPPKRELIPEGKYAAIIMTALPGDARWAVPPVPKVRVEFQLLHRQMEDGAIDDTEQGRRVYQDFILAPVENMPDLKDRHRYELQQLWDACGIEPEITVINGREVPSFDTDDLLQKTVIIDVVHRPGKEKDRDPNTGEIPIFTNVKRIDGPKDDAVDDLI